MTTSDPGASRSAGEPESQAVAGRRPLRPIPWWWAAVGALIVALAIWASTWWLLAQTHGLAGSDRATARMDAIKTGLSVGAGTGGAVALLLALRRQWLSERDQAHREEVARHTQLHGERVAAATEHDAAERRVTDLYVKAADQLGSDKAPVRLAGLYALERLAQDNPTQRQTVVDVLCAYLRMPFTPPTELGDPPDRAEQLPRQEEQQVRRAAERILAAHLRDGGARSGSDMPVRSTIEPLFWPGMKLDLTGATLLGEFGHGCRITSAVFDDAVFIGSGDFSHAVFEIDGFFKSTRFIGGPGHFYNVRFGNRAVFVGTDFGDHEANFRDVRFHGMTFFGDAKIDRGVTFDGGKVLIEFDSWAGNDRSWPPGWTAQDNDQDSDEIGWGLIVPSGAQTTSATKRKTGPTPKKRP